MYAVMKICILTYRGISGATFYGKSYCELIECSRPIRFFIVSLMYNNIIYFSFMLTDISPCVCYCFACARVRLVFEL